MDYKVKIKHIDNSCEIAKLPDAAKAFMASKILQNNLNQDALIIASDAKEIEDYIAQIQFFYPEVLEKFEILSFPAWDCLPYDSSSPKSVISASRIKALYKIANRNNDQRFLIITSVNSLIQKTISPKELNNYGLKIGAKSQISIGEISKFLAIGGYERSISANSPGEFAIRGGIVDFVCEQASDLIGYRIDFFGDEIESIKAFDPLTQITYETLKEIEILPTSETILNEKTIGNFRQKYRENFGAALDDQLYLAISEKRSYMGMEHWLPFFYEENW